VFLTVSNPGLSFGTIGWLTDLVNHAAGIGIITSGRGTSTMSNDFPGARGRTESAAGIAVKDESQEIADIIQVLAIGQELQKWINSAGLRPPRASGPEE
jgi:hypothetical protein